MRQSSAAVNKWQKLPADSRSKVLELNSEPVCGERYSEKELKESYTPKWIHSLLLTLAVLVVGRPDAPPLTWRQILEAAPVLRELCAETREIAALPCCNVCGCAATDVDTTGSCAVEGCFGKFVKPPPSNEQQAEAAATATRQTAVRKGRGKPITGPSIDHASTGRVRVSLSQVRSAET